MDTASLTSRRQILHAFAQLLVLRGAEREAALAARPQIHAQVRALLEADSEAADQNYLGSSVVDGIVPVQLLGHDAPAGSAVATAR